MSIAELDVAIDKAQQNLNGLLLEVKNNPDESAQENARERAFSQFEALLAMHEQQGNLVRSGIAKIREGETEREIDLDPDSVRALNKVRE